MKWRATRDTYLKPSGIYKEGTVIEARRQPSEDWTPLDPITAPPSRYRIGTVDNDDGRQYREAAQSRGPSESDFRRTRTQALAGALYGRK